MKFPHLFSPMKIGNMEVRNRIVMSPMTTDFAALDGEPTDRLIDYYAARAEGGVGLILTEDTSIGPSYSVHTLRINDDRLIPAWRKLVGRVHEHGCLIAPALMHPTFNARSFINDGRQPVAVSPHASRIARELPRELTVEEIAGLVDRFVEDAMRAKAVGCDAVMIHCAHNHHLLGTFLSPLTNKRSDEYGGDMLGRAKLALDVIRAIRAAVGPDFPIMTRISAREVEPGGRAIDESMVLAPLLVEAGVDAIQISTATLGSMPFLTTPPMGTPLAPNAADAELIKSVVDVPIICGTRITQPIVAEDVLARGRADFVGMGRTLLADPAFANKTKAGTLDDIMPCWGCLHCLATASSDQKVVCSTNPAVGFEREMTIEPASQPKVIAVVGGGCAGLEFAAKAARRGHKVTLFEKTAKLGGQLFIASVAPLKQETTLLIKYLVGQARKAGVEIRLNEEATADTIRQLSPDVVIDATGGVPIAGKFIPGHDNPNVIQAWDVLAGRVLAGRRSVVIGGGQVGCETADFLAHPNNDMHPFGNQVTLIELQPNIALKERTSARSLLVSRMLQKNVQIITGATVTKIEDDKVFFERGGAEGVVDQLDSIVLGIGTSPRTEFREAVQGLDAEYHAIGDVVEPRQAGHAIFDAARLALKI